MFLFRIYRYEPFPENRIASLVLARRVTISCVRFVVSQQQTPILIPAIDGLDRQQVMAAVLPTSPEAVGNDSIAGPATISTSVAGSICNLVLRHGDCRRNEPTSASSAWAGEGRRSQLLRPPSSPSLIVTQLYSIYFHRYKQVLYTGYTVFSFAWINKQHFTMGKVLLTGKDKNPPPS